MDRGQLMPIGLGDRIRVHGKEIVHGHAAQAVEEAGIAGGARAALALEGIGFQPVVAIDNDLDPFVR